MPVRDNVLYHLLGDNIINFTLDKINIMVINI